MAYLAALIAMIGETIFSSFLSLHLNKNYNVSEDEMGFYMLFHCAPYLPAALILPALFIKVPAKL
jgi:hypothetical protein